MKNKKFDQLCEEYLKRYTVNEANVLTNIAGHIGSAIKNSAVAAAKTTWDTMKQGQDFWKGLVAKSTYNGKEAKAEQDTGNQIADKFIDYSLSNHEVVNKKLLFSYNGGATSMYKLNTDIVRANISGYTERTTPATILIPNAPYDLLFQIGFKDLSGIFDKGSGSLKSELQKMKASSKDQTIKVNVVFKILEKRVKNLLKMQVTPNEKRVMEKIAWLYILSENNDTIDAR